MANPKNLRAPFQPGCKPGPGRPKGSKNRSPHQMADMMMLCSELLGEKASTPEARKRLKADIDKKFNANPVAFILKVCLPLMPRETLVELARVMRVDGEEGEQGPRRIDLFAMHLTRTGATDDSLDEIRKAACRRLDLPEDTVLEAGPDGVFEGGEEPAAG